MVALATRAAAWQQRNSSARRPSRHRHEHQATAGRVEKLRPMMAPGDASRRHAAALVEKFLSMALAAPTTSPQREHQLVAGEAFLGRKAHADRRHG
ncbi:Os06g0117000 [Oryza sativa Japonica Group]|uniref:Os06g0117000 protein n=1 Tax=Oryza sativa subsp. japonica TaxID=39947 RepID=A0A0P0WRL7_ORYSJ|nr:Os06g0117000 [Oryza sativa Japonica Group]